MKLYRTVKDERRNSDGRVSYGVRLSEKFIDPKRQLKMNVSLEKRAMEDKTLSYGISKVIVELEMKVEDLAKHVAKAKEKHPFKKNTSTLAYSTLRHCNHLAESVFLNEYVNKDQGDAVASNADYVLDNDNNDISMSDMEGDSDGRSDDDDEENHVDMTDNPIEDDRRTENEQDDTISELKKDTATLVYGSHLILISRSIFEQGRETYHCK